jgi:hypothetical protein
LLNSLIIRILICKMDVENENAYLLLSYKMMMLRSNITRIMIAHDFQMPC